MHQYWFHCFLFAISCVPLFAQILNFLRHTAAYTVILNRSFKTFNIEINLYKKHKLLYCSLVTKSLVCLEGKVLGLGLAGQVLVNITASI